MAKLKRTRTYLFFVRNTVTNQLYGIVKGYTGWELKNNITYFHQLPRVPEYPSSRLPPTDLQRAQWKENHDHQRYINHFPTVIANMKAIKLAENLEMFWVRAGSKKCPVHVDWESLHRKVDLQYKLCVPYTIKAS